MNHQQGTSVVIRPGRALTTAAVFEKGYDNSSNKQKKDGTMPRLSLSDLSALGAEDRIAVMNMVKEGEVTIDQAIAKVKAEVLFKEQAKLGLTLGQSNIARRGAVNCKKYRGRMKVKLRLEKSGKSLSLVCDLEDCRDLLPTKRTGAMDPFIKLFIAPDGTKKETQVQKTSVHKDTKNPIFNEGYSWEIKSDCDEARTRLNIHVYDSNGFLRKADFIGGMSFSVKEIKTAEKPIIGWFRLMDDKLCYNDNRKYELKKKKAICKKTSSRRKKSKSPKKSQPKKRSPSPPPMKAKVKKAPIPEVDTSTPTRAQEDTSPSQTPTPLAVTQPSTTTSTVATPSVKEQVEAEVQQEIQTPSLQMDISSFDYLKVLGQGSFGKVMLAEHKSSKDIFAIKVLGKKEVLEDDDIESTMTERRVLALAGNCKFLTKMYATFQTPERLYYVMEFLNGGDLMYHIQCQSRFTDAQVQFYTAEILIGLSYLHDNGVIYRDLKLDNVMLNAEGHIKIADFGMCKENMLNGALTKTFCGTPGYLAPEILAERSYAKSVDFWSLGIMVFEMICGESPFDSDDDDELFRMILNDPVEYPDYMGSDAQSLLQGFLTRDETKRLGCDDQGMDAVRSHEYFIGLDWTKLTNGEIEPPFKPVVGKGTDTKNFDEEFTNCDINLSPVDKRLVDQFDQTAFNGFSFINEETFMELSNTTDSDSGPATSTRSSTASVTESTAVLSEVQNAKERWYRPDLKRKVIADMLKNTDRGTFYVRDSSSHENSYALTVCVGASKPWNGLISTLVHADGSKHFRLFQETKFDSISHLINYYRDRPIMRTVDDKPIMLLLP